MLHVEREQNYFHSLWFHLLTIVSAILFGCQIVGMLLVFLAWVKTILFQIKKDFVPKSTASLSASRHAVMFTLKQTHRENGSVTITMAQEKAVRSQPQMPMPTSLSCAAKKKKESVVFFFLSSGTFFLLVWVYGKGVNHGEGRSAKSWIIEAGPTNCHLLAIYRPTTRKLLGWQAAASALIRTALPCRRTEIAVPQSRNMVPTMSSGLAGCCCVLCRRRRRRCCSSIITSSGGK